MTPLKISVLIVLILGVFCQYIAGFYQGPAKACCYGYKEGGTLPVHLIRRHYKTPSDCAIEAVVFEMKRGKHICANPRDSWVKQTISLLEKRKTRKN